jgi:type II secretory pathway pseudopilin PulG
MTMNACDRKRSRGFTYLGVLFAVAFMGVTLALIAQIWSTYDRRAKEQQLLFVGSEFRAAIQRYFEASPGPQKQFPASLEDLLRDKRFPDTRRYLRKIYTDPLTGKADWGLVKGVGGVIVGVYSRAPGGPVKIANFRNEFAFDGKKSYAEWIFVVPVGPGMVAATSANGIAATVQNSSAGGTDAASATIQFGQPTVMSDGGTTAVRDGPPKVADSATREEACNAAYSADVAECEITFPDTQYAHWGSPAKANCKVGSKSRLNECMKQH